LSRPTVEFSGDCAEACLTDIGDRKAFREVLTEQTIGVLVQATLPRAGGIAEIDLHVQRRATEICTSARGRRWSCRCDLGPCLGTHEETILVDRRGIKGRPEEAVMYGHERRFHDRDEDTDEVIDEREAAKRRIRARRDFTSNLVAFAVVGAALVVIWALSGAGYFWPAWIIGIWGVILVLHWWNTFGRRPMTEADVDAEMSRHHR